MKLTISSEFDYIPEWNDNQDEDEPIVFHCRYLTAGERDKVMDFSTSFEDGEPVPKATIDRRAVIEKCVKSIENLTINSRNVTTAKQLIEEPALGGLYMEVAMELVSRNMTPDLKN